MLPGVKRREFDRELDPTQAVDGRPRVEIKPSTTRVEAPFRPYRHGGSIPPGSIGMFHMRKPTHLGRLFSLVCGVSPVASESERARVCPETLARPFGTTGGKPNTDQNEE